MEPKQPGFCQKCGGCCGVGGLLGASTGPGPRYLYSESCVRGRSAPLCDLLDEFESSVCDAEIQESKRKKSYAWIILVSPSNKQDKGNMTQRDNRQRDPKQNMRP